MMKLTKSEIIKLKFAVRDYIHDRKIVEYDDLIADIKENDRLDLADIVLNHTNFTTKVINSARHKKIANNEKELINIEVNNKKE